MLLGEVLRQRLVEFFKGLQIAPKRLFHNEAGPALGFVLHARLFNGHGRVRKGRRRNGKIKEAVVVLDFFVVGVFRLEGLDGFRHGCKGAFVTVRFAGLVDAALQKTLNDFTRMVRVFFEKGAEPIAEVVVTQIGARKAPDLDFGRQEVVIVEVEQRGIRLFLGQIARSAHDDNAQHRGGQPLEFFLGGSSLDDAALA